MCASCFSSADSLLLSSAGALAALREARRWLRLRTTTTRPERRRARWAEDAEFIRTLGMAPVEVLGPPPVVVTDALPVEDPVEAPDRVLVLA